MWIVLPVPQNRVRLISFFASILPSPLGTASGEFLRPAASALLLFRFLPKIFGNEIEHFCAPPEMQTLALGADPSRFRVPQLQGQKMELEKKCTKIASNSSDF